MVNHWVNLWFVMVGNGSSMVNNCSKKLNEWLIMVNQWIIYGQSIVDNG